MIVRKVGQNFMKRASIFLSVILYIIIYLGNNSFFGDFVYLWILGLLVISFLGYFKKYKIAFFFLIFFVPILLSVAAFLDLYHFLEEIPSALYLLVVFLIYMFGLNYHHVSKWFKVNTIVGICFLVIIMMAIIDFQELTAGQKPIFMIPIHDEYYGLGYKGSYNTVYEDGRGYIDCDFGLWIATWSFRSEFWYLTV